MVRGIWLVRATLTSLLDRTAEIYSAPAGRSVSRAELDAAVSTFARLRAQGWPVRWQLLRKLRERLERAGLPIDEGLFRGVAANAGD
jgi:hypothetical protein